MDPRVLARYNSAEGARSYRDDYRVKLHRKLSDRRERGLFAELFRRTGRLESLLDCPCGRGRLRELFLGYSDQVWQVDWSMPMLLESRLELDGDGDAARRRTPYVRASALELPFRDRAFDCVVSVRLSHHIDDATERERHVRELMRVAARYVIVSYYSHHSLKNLWRRMRRRFDNKRAKNTLTTGRVADLARDSGFVLEAAPALSLVASGHRFALLRRRDER